VKRAISIVLACVLAVSLSAAGCGGGDTPPKPTPRPTSTSIPAPTPTPAPTSTPIAFTDDDYIDSVAALARQHKEAVNAANEVIALQTELMVSGDEYTACEILKISMESFIGECTGINEQWDAITPTSNFADYHECFYLWSGAQIEAFELIAEAAGTHDADVVLGAVDAAESIVSSVDDISVCETLYEEALARMAQVTPTPTPSSTAVCTPTPASTTGVYPRIEWARTFSGAGGKDVACSVQQTFDGGYIVAGWMSIIGSKGWESDIGIIKIDGNGTEEWRSIYGGSEPDGAYSVHQTSDSGYIVAGYTGSIGEGGTDIWLIKMDENGKGQWSKTFGSYLMEMANFVHQASDGGYIIAGFGASGLSADLWLIKTDNNGTQKWRRVYGGADHYGSGSVQQTSDGGYIMTGATGATLDEMDFWLLKVNKDGVERWARTFGGEGADVAGSVQQTFDGGYIIAGYTESFGAGGEDIWLVKTDEKGEEEWNDTYGGAGDDVANSVQQTSDGGYLIAGSTSSYGAGGKDLWLVKTDASGEMEWSWVYGGYYDDGANSVQQTSDGGYVVAGYTEIHGTEGFDYWVIKLKQPRSAEE